MEFPGTRYDSSALASSFGQTVQAEVAASELKARAYGALSELLASTAAQLSAQAQQRAEARRERDFAAGQAREGRTFQAGQAEQDRLFQESQGRLGREHQAALSQRGILAGLAEAGVAQQGLDATALMDLFAAPPRLGAPPGAPPVPTPPGGPGGYLIGQQEGDGGYQGLQLESRRPQGGSFGNIPRVPRQSTVEELRFQRDEQRRAEEQRSNADLQRLRAEFNAFTMSPKGRKAFYLPVKMKRRDAYGLEGLPPQQLEEQVQALWPHTRIQKTQGALGEEAKVDRSNLDAHLQWLNEQVSIEVGSGPVAAQMYQHAREKYGQQGIPPEIIDQAMNEWWKENQGFASSMLQAKDIARSRILEMDKAAQRQPRPVEVSVQGSSLGQVFSGLADQTEGQRVAAGAGGPIQGRRWTKEFASEVTNFDALPKMLQSAALVGYELEEGPNGSVRFRSPDGSPVPDRTQEALLKLQSRPEMKGRLQAALGMGAAPASKGEIDAAQAARARAPVTDESTPAAPAAPESGARQSALERYRASKRGKQTPRPAEPREGWPKGLPQQIGLFKNPQVDAILELLAGGK